MLPCTSHIPIHVTTPPKKKHSFPRSPTLASLNLGDGRTLNFRGRGIAFTLLLGYISSRDWHNEGDRPAECLEVVESRVSTWPYRRPLSQDMNEVLLHLLLLLLLPLAVSLTLTIMSLHLSLEVFLRPSG